MNYTNTFSFVGYAATSAIEIRDVRRPRTVPKGYDMKKFQRWGVTEYNTYTNPYVTTGGGTYTSNNTSYAWGNLYGNAQRTS